MLALLSFFALPAGAQGLLEQRLNEPVLLTVDSLKPISALEYCVANAMTASAGIPHGAYRDGPRRLVIFANRVAEYKIFLAVTLTEVASGTKIEVRGRNENALQGFQSVLMGCV